MPVKADILDDIVPGTESETQISVQGENPFLTCKIQKFTRIGKNEKATQPSHWCNPECIVGATIQFALPGWIENTGKILQRLTVNVGVGRIIPTGTVATKLSRA